MKNENNFNNPSVLISFLVVSLFFMGWQFYLQKKYPDYYKSKTSQELQTEQTDALKAQQVTGDIKNSQVGSEVVSSNDNEKPIGSLDLKKSQYVTLSNELYNVRFTSAGLGIDKVELKKFKGEDNKYVNLDTQLFYSVDPQQGMPINFSFSKKSKMELVGLSEHIKKTIRLNPGSYALDVKIEVLKPLETNKLSFVSQMKLKEFQNSLLSPSYERQEFFISQKNQEVRETLSMDYNTSSVYENSKILSLGTRYFAESIVNRSSVSSLVEVLPKLGEVPQVMFRQSQSLQGIEPSQLRLEYEIFLGPKKESLLSAVDPDLGRVIDYGFFEILSRPLMKILEFFHSIFGNWGWAIVLLTLVIRLLVFPVAFLGYKSMKKMQTIQPALKKIKEKYKADPQKMNSETMAFMKQNKVNPVGGCLPMLLQIPVLFAFYSLLSESVVMYQAPFIGWIQDLSLKDPYFLLPILMGVAMFFQQKLTPMAVEPMQKKMMMFMPIAFSFFMISLPSALTLYIFVSTLFGIVQQYIFLKMT